MDFFRFRTKENRNGTTELYPGFIVGRSNDLMVRGGQFYAVWDEKEGLWSTDEYAVARLVDAEMYAHADEPQHHGRAIVVRDMASFGHTAAIADWRTTNLEAAGFWPAQGFLAIAHRYVRTVPDRAVTG